MGTMCCASWHYWVSPKAEISLFERLSEPSGLKRFIEQGDYRPGRSVLFLKHVFVWLLEFPFLLHEYLNMIAPYSEQVG